MRFDNLFEATTLKLTGWYVLILMMVSIMFSVLVFNITIGEVQQRLDRYEKGIMNSSEITSGVPILTQLHADQIHQAKVNLFLALLYINIAILFIGGVGGYLLARRTLRPIERAHDAQSRFVSDASHELRTPLTVMRTELEVALRDPKLPKKDMKELLESNLEEVQKLTELSTTLLKLSRGETQKLNFESFLLRKIAEPIIEKHNKPHNRITLAKGKGVQVRAHKASIEELLVILIDNALKYSSPDTPIRIEITKKRDVSIAVTNEGPGISAKDLPHIFDRFYRADTSRRSEGSGLGLALAKQIVDLHGGSIDVTSDKQRTTFTVHLPVHTKQSQKS